MGRVMGCAKWKGVEKMTTMRELENDLEEGIIDAYKNGSYDWEYPHDTLCELVDSYVPIYYGEIAAVLMSDSSLGWLDDEGLVGENANTHERIQAAIYERLSAKAHEVYSALEEEE